MRPLCIDLYCGLGGWAEGFLAEGWDVIGFDNHRHEYGEAKYPGHLVIQDVLTLHGSQFRNATVIVASPPCQNYSYLAMPWSRSSDPNNSKKAKELRRTWETKGPDNRLFDACFRIQREAIEATDAGYCRACGHPKEWHESDGCGEYIVTNDSEGFCFCTEYSPSTRYIPLIVENVRGAQPWVGRSAWNYGSFHLWGDVPALMPIALKVPAKRAMDDLKCGQRKLLHQHLPVGNGPLGRNDGTELKWSGGVADAIDAMRGRKANLDGQNVPGFRFDGSGRSFQSASVEHTKQGVAGDGKSYGGDFGWDGSAMRTGNSRSNARKAASAQIAKIPLPLAQHIAAIYKPRTKAVA